MAKLKSPEEFLALLDISLDDAGCGMLDGRNTRLLEIGVFQIGDDDFDRWANSVESEFDLSQSKGQRHLRRWLDDVEITS